MRNSGDGWLEGPNGTRVWGRFGAAGLLCYDPHRGVLLQHRASWSHHGDTWGIPGGARNAEETAIEGALRESHEEAAVPAENLRLRSTIVRDLGFWQYTTVIAEVTTPFEAHMNDAESHELAWVEVSEVHRLQLHPGFAEAWPRIQRLLTRNFELIIDVANVMGSKPNGWWHNRAAAAKQLITELSPLAQTGCTGQLFGTDAQWVWPRVTFVVEGEARSVARSTASVGTRILAAAGSGDDAIVAAIDPAATTVVVTADRELRARVAARDTRCIGPRCLPQPLGYSQTK